MNQYIKNVVGMGKVCAHCVMNSTDPNLKFDENGVCDRFLLHKRCKSRL